MELTLDMHDDGPEFARVNKTLKDKDGRPIGIAADNTILNTRIYEVEYADGYKKKFQQTQYKATYLTKSTKMDKVLCYSTPS